MVKQLAPAPPPPPGNSFVQTECSLPVTVGTPLRSSRPVYCSQLPLDLGEEPSFRMPRFTRLPQWVGGMELSPHWLLSDQEDLRSTGATNVPIQVSWSHPSREKGSTQLVSGRHSFTWLWLPLHSAKSLKWAAHLGEYMTIRQLLKDNIPYASLCVVLSRRSEHTVHPHDEAFPILRCQ